MPSTPPIHCLQIKIVLISLSACLSLAAAMSAAGYASDALPEPVGHRFSNDGRSFLHIAETGAMVGGGTAISDIWYIGSTGLVQRARLETSGALHTLASTHTDTKTFLKSALPLVKRLAEWKRAAPDTDQGTVATEYYPPTITVCSLLPPEMGRICVTFEAEHPPDALKTLKAETNCFFNGLNMTEAVPGLYASLQLIPQAADRFIAVDYKIDQLDEAARILVAELLANEMAIVKTIPLALSRTTPKATCGGLLTAGCACYIQAENQVYLMTASLKTKP
jgi:hypothetical protein